MNDENLLKLQKETGCDLILGKMLLKFTGNDIEGAIKIINSVDKDVYVIRGKFIAQNTKYYGTFIYFYENRNKVVDKIIFAIRQEDKSAIEFDFNISWEDFRKQLDNYTKANIMDAVLQEKFIYQLKNHKSLSVFEKTIALSKEYDEKTLKLFFDDVLFNIIGDPDIAVKLVIDKTNIFEMNKGDVKLEDFEQQEPVSKIEEKKITEEPLHSQDLIIINIEPQLAPIDGVPLTEISSGEQILVKISDTKPIVEYIATLLKAKDLSTNENLPIYATLKEISRSEHGYIIKVEFGPGIIGIGYFGEDVKIKVKRNSDYQFTENSKPAVSNFVLKNFWIIGTLFIAAIAILIVLIFRP